MSKLGDTSSGYRQKLAQGFLLVSSIALVVCALTYTGLSTSLSRIIVEHRFELTKRAPTGDIVIVDIDARSLKNVGVWPWPRHLYGELVEKLVEGGAEQVAFDIDFSSRSTEAEDVAFAEALEKADILTGLAMFSQSAEFASSDELSSQKWDEEVVNRPIEPLLDVSWPVVVSVPMEPDGHVWRGLTGQTIDGIFELSLPAFVAGIETTSSQTFWIDYGIDESALTTVSFVDVLSGDVPEDVFTGRKVIVGASAQELRDLFSVPVHEIMPGSVIQALSAESMMQGRALSWMGSVELGVLSLAIVFPLILFVGVSWKVRLLALALTAIAFEVVGLLLQMSFPWMLATGPAQLVLALTGLQVILKQIGLGQFLLLISRAQHYNDQRVLTQVFEDSFDSIVIVDEDGIVTAVSRSAKALFATPEGSHLAPGVEAADHLPPEILQEIMLCMSRDDADYHPVPKTAKVLRAPGEKRIVEYVVNSSQLKSITDDGVRENGSTLVASVTCRDVTEQRTAVKKLAYLAKYETLTGLLNRSSFTQSVSEQLASKVRHKSRCTMAMFTVNGMDRISASLGFHMADQLRQRLAKRMVEALDPEDPIALIGDDKFACFLQFEGTESTAFAYINNLRDQLVGEYDIEGIQVPVSLNIGYTVALTKDINAELLLSQSDNALSMAHADSSVKVVRFDQELEAKVRRRQHLEVELSKAIERNQLHVLYQPQVDLASRQVIGVEALLRWKHPDLGFVPPDEFISIAEESGRIHQLGAWVLQEAIREASNWSRPIRLAVNVSAHQLTRGDLHVIVGMALAKYDFPAHMLDLELTESLFIDESIDLATPINAVLGLGCSLAMDDFGTGYSGLAYLTRFPFSKIKIDRAFISDMEQNKGHHAIVSAVVDLATAYNMNVVAEGIETESQAKLLVDLKCEIGQGYLFGRPISAEDLDTMLLQNAA
ncbi:MAG: EAL domain-containing protein [Rhodobacteraceae bacterium]|nr:EAL domain-containing protein [Paracoccaceae bacterium]